IPYATHADYDHLRRGAGTERTDFTSSEPQPFGRPGHYRSQCRQWIRRRAVHHVRQRYWNDESVLTAADEFYRRAAHSAHRILPVVYRRTLQQQHLHPDRYRDRDGCDRLPLLLHIDVRRQPDDDAEPVSRRQYMGGLLGIRHRHSAVHYFGFGVRLDEDQ